MIIAPLSQLRDELHWVVGAQKDHEPVTMSTGIDGESLVIGCGGPFEHHESIVPIEGDDIGFGDVAIPGRIAADWLSTQTGKTVMIDTEDSKVLFAARGTCRFPKVAVPAKGGSALVPELWFDLDADPLHLGVQAVSGHARREADKAQEWESAVHLSPTHIWGGSPYSGAVVPLQSNGRISDGLGPMQVPRKALKGALAGATGSVEFLRSDSYALWVRHGGRLSRLGVYEYTIPEFTRLVNQPYTEQLCVDAVELRAAVKSVMIETDVIEINAKDELLHIGCHQSSKGQDPSARASADVSYMGDEWSVVIDAGFLSAALETIEGDAIIKWQGEKPRKPILVTDGAQVFHTIAVINTAR